MTGLLASRSNCKTMTAVGCLIMFQKGWKAFVPFKGTASELHLRKRMVGNAIHQAELLPYRESNHARQSNALLFQLVPRLDERLLLSCNCTRARRVSILGASPAVSWPTPTVERLSGFQFRLRDLHPRFVGDGKQVVGPTASTTVSRASR